MMIKIEDVKLVNFLSHVNSYVEFKAPINVILGPNGAGKSSIIDAIYFALFRDSPRGKKEDLIKKGKSSASVELTLLFGEHQVKIRREITRSSSENDLLYLDDKLLARGVASVNRELEKLIGLDNDSALSTIFIQQGRMEEVFNNLYDIFSKLLKIDKIEKLIDTNGPIKKYHDQLEEKYEFIKQQEPKLMEWKDSLTKLNEDINSLNSIISETNNKINNLMEKYNEEKKRLEEYEVRRQNYIKLISQKEQLVKQISDIKDEIEKLQEKVSNISYVEKEVEELRIYRDILPIVTAYTSKLSQLSMLDNYIERLNNDINDLKNKLEAKKRLEPQYTEYNELQQEQKRLEPQYTEYIAYAKSVEESEKLLKEREEELNKLQVPDINEITKRLEEKRKLAEELDEESGRIKAEEENLKDAIEKLDKSANKGVCPVCGRELSEHSRLQLITEYRAKLNELNNRKKEVQLQVNRIKNEIRDLEREKENAQRKANTALMLNEEIKRLKEEIDEKKRRVEELRGSYNAYLEIKRRVEERKSIVNEYMKYASYTQEKLDNLIKELEQKQEELERLEDEIEEIKRRTPILDLELVKSKVKDLEEKEKLLNELKGIAARLEVLKQQKEELQSRINNIERDIENLKYDESTYNALKVNVDNLQKQVNDFNVKLSEAKGRLNSLLEYKNQLEKSIHDFEALLSEKNKIEKALLKLEKLREALGKKYLQSYLINAAKGIVEEHLNDILARFDLSFTRVELDFSDSLGKKTKGNIVAYLPDGQKVTVNSLSGGEKIAVALALRLALAKLLIRDIGFIIMDEPTVFLDKQRRSDLLDVIRSATDIVPEIIIVTHDDEVVNVAEYVLEVNKEGESSKVIEGGGK